MVLINERIIKCQNEIPFGIVQAVELDAVKYVQFIIINKTNVNDKKVRDIFIIRQ